MTAINKNTRECLDIYAAVFSEITYDTITFSFTINPAVVSSCFRKDGNPAIIVF